MIINIISFYGLWWAIALMANKGYDFFLFLLLLLFLTVHFKFVVLNFKIEVKTMIFTMLLGLVFDLGLHLFGFFKYIGNYYFWLPMIWLGFSSTINHSMKKLFSNNIILLVFSILGGPFTYYGASRLGLLTYNTNVQYLLVHGILWVLFMWSIKFIKGVTHEMD